MSAALLSYRGTLASIESREKPAAPWRSWLRRKRIRRELAVLHPEQLREVGLDPDAVRAEALKPFWRA